MRLFVITLFSLVILNCTVKENKSDSPFQYKWGSEGKVLIQKGKLHTNTHFDSLTQKMVGDTLIPFLYSL